MIVMIHYKHLRDPTDKPLFPGDEVEFSLEQGPKGYSGSSIVRLTQREKKPVSRPTYQNYSEHSGGTQRNGQESGRGAGGRQGEGSFGPVGGAPAPERQAAVNSAPIENPYEQAGR